MHVFGRNEWKEFAGKLYSRAYDTNILDSAAVVAFYFSFSFFPLLFFLITLAGLVLGSTYDLKRDLYSYLFQIMPISAYDLVQKTLDEIIENSSGGKLTVSLLITLWSASAGVDALRSSLNAVYGLKECRSLWNIKLQSLLLTFLFILLLGISLLAVSAGLKVFDHFLLWAGFPIESPLLLVVVQWLSLVAVLIFATEVIYNWLPCHKRFKWFWATPGSAVAILLWVVFTGGFRVYLQYFNSYNKAYGSLAAVIILMLWMFLSAIAILLGGAINAIIREMVESASEDNSREPQHDEDAQKG